MTLPDILRQVEARVQRNSPEILTALGVSGVVTTSYLSAKAGYATAHLLDGEPEDLSFKERVAVVWRLYIPTGISGALTVASIVYASKLSGRRAGAAVAAYSLTERAFSEYREKVVEQLGAAKEQKIRDDIRQDQVNQTKEVVILGSGGEVLCCELLTRRYFRSNMETLRKAVNETNFRITNQYEVALDEFYDAIGLPHTSVSSNIGWDSSKLMDIDISTVLSPENEPCLAFDYNYTKPL